MIIIAYPDKKPGCRFAPFAFPVKTGMSLRSICNFAYLLIEANMMVIAPGGEGCRLRSIQPTFPSKNFGSLTINAVKVRVAAARRNIW